MSRIHRVSSEYKVNKTKGKNVKQYSRVSKWVVVVNWFILIFAAAVLGYGLIAFGASEVHVSDSSMEKTLNNGDDVIINKLAYVFSDVKRFDVVAFKKMESTGYYNIKRIVGLPGEKVKIENGKIYINDVLLDFELDQIMNEGIAGQTITLGSDEYFVIGDNINNSEDSRYSNIGNIMKSEIKGKVFYILKPSKRRGKL